MLVTVKLEGKITVNDDDGGDRDAIVEAHLDLVMNELETLNATDPSIDLDLNDCSVVLSITVETGNPVDAVATASGLLRTAIHAAGGGTPDWPDLSSEEWGISLTGVQSSLVNSQDLDEPELLDA